MVQTAVVYNQPPAFEGMLGTQATSVIRGASQELYNASTTQRLPWGRGVELKNGNQIALPTAATTTIYGITFYNEQWGASRSFALSTPGSVEDGYPPLSPVGVLTFGDIWVVSEEAVNIDDPVYIRKVAGSGQNIILGRTRKSADGTNTLAFPKARFIKKTTGPGLVMINIGGF